jgi:hypothetical protein
MFRQTYNWCVRLPLTSVYWNHGLGTISRQSLDSKIVRGKVLKTQELPFGIARKVLMPNNLGLKSQNELWISDRAMPRRATFE